jgi:membrane fusion protein (multidrug efflux system)
MQKKRLLAMSAIAGLMLVAGCSDTSKAPAAQRLEVSTTKVISTELPVYNELPGRVVSPRVAEVRARVTGVIKKQYFTEGAEVRAGDLLFLIDPEPMQAAYQSAKAALQKAEATLAQSERTAARYEELVKVGAVSQQDCDEATSTLAEKRAEVLAAAATLKTAELNLGYTKVTAPISGRIGKAMVTEGGMVSASALTELALIQQLDPIYFDFTQSNADVLKLRRSITAGRLSGTEKSSTPVTLTLEDASTYEHTGKLLFADISVDETTGMVMLRAEFDNPERLLLPGSFARIRVAQAVNKNSLLILQRAVLRNKDGTGRVYVVDDTGKVEQRTITTGSAVGDKWLVENGLATGETVVVEGVQKVKNGQIVSAIPFETAPVNVNASAKGL